MRIYTITTRMSADFFDDVDIDYCRWSIGDMKLDVMSTDKRILWFSNRWHKTAIEASIVVPLSD